MHLQQLLMVLSPDLDAVSKCDIVFIGRCNRLCVPGIIPTVISYDASSHAEGQATVGTTVLILPDTNMST